MVNIARKHSNWPDMERLREIWKSAEETNNIQELFESGPLDYKSILAELFNIFDVAFTFNFVG